MMADKIAVAKGPFRKKLTAKCREFNLQSWAQTQSKIPRPYFTNYVAVGDNSSEEIDPPMHPMARDWEDAVPDSALCLADEEAPE